MFLVTDIALHWDGEEQKSAKEIKIVALTLEATLQPGGDEKRKARG